MLSRSPLWLLSLASLVPCVSSLDAHSQTSREETKMELRSRRHPWEEGHRALAQEGLLLWNLSLLELKC